MYIKEKKMYKSKEFLDTDKDIIRTEGGRCQEMIKFDIVRREEGPKLPKS